MAAPTEVSLPQTMLQKLLDLLRLEMFCLKIHVHVIRHIRCQVNINYHNQHESAALIGLFHVTSSVLPSVESYLNYQKPTQRSTGVPLLSTADSILAFTCRFLRSHRPRLINVLIAYIYVLCEH